MGYVADGGWVKADGLEDRGLKYELAVCHPVLFEIPCMKIRIFSKRRTFDRVQLGKCLAILGEQILTFFIHILFSSGIIGPQQDIAFHDNLGIVPLSSS